MNIGTSSVYTVGNFDGMVLVIDPYGGRVRYSSRLYAEDADVARVEAFEGS